jgi:gluconolactonase
MDPSGKHLGTIAHGEPATTNMGWGDNDWRTLYFTSRDSLFRTRLNIPGIPVPVAKAG